jgi:2-polyprenyl-6-methoxyphenol hydroxylase-like FAD-dependent oxidoreductase
MTTAIVGGGICGLTLALNLYARGIACRVYEAALTGDKPFDNLDDFITQDELRALSDSYKRIAGFAVADVKRV